MKKTQLALILGGLAIVVSGCGFNRTAEPLQTDSTVFEPVHTLVSEPLDVLPGQTPHQKSLMTAISYDGLNFVPNDGWVADQAQAPDAIIKDGSIYLYYSGWLVGKELNKTALAISEDNGQTWTHHHLTFIDKPVSDAMSPDVVLLEDGTIRMFFNATTGAKQGIFYADSPDGINFTFKTEVGGDEEQVFLDSTTEVFDETWMQYIQGEDASEVLLYEGEQSDSLQYAGLTSFPPDGVPHYPINGYWLGEKYHMLLIDPDTMEMRSMRTENGSDWYTTEGLRIDKPADNEAITDATVVPLEDGTYLMIYTIYHSEV